MKHRKHTSQENNKLKNYLFHTKLASFGSLLITLFGLVQIIINVGIFDFSLSSLYFITTMAILITIVIRSYFLPTCYQQFPAIILWKLKDEYLESLNVYYKKREGIELNKEEQHTYKMEEFSLFMFFIYNYIPIIGVILFIVLDIWYGLNGMIAINV